MNPCLTHTNMHRQLLRNTAAIHCWEFKFVLYSRLCKEYRFGNTGNEKTAINSLMFLPVNLIICINAYAISIYPSTFKVWGVVPWKNSESVKILLKVPGFPYWCTHKKYFIQNISPKKFNKQYKVRTLYLHNLTRNNYWPLLYIQDPILLKKTE
jgi:hypothetical protein